MNLTQLTHWKVKEDCNSSAYSACDDSDVTHFLEGEGGRAIRQPTPHAINPTSLTSWKVKEEGNSSAHVACDESDITYKLQGEGGQQFVSPCCMQCIWCHLHPGRRRGNTIRQPTLHVMNLASLTSWKAKGEGNSWAHATCDESNITYCLEGEGGWQIVSPCCMWWIWRHSHPGRWRRKANR